MTKIKAALIHIFISALVIGLLLLIIFTIWYPKPFVSISGVIEPLKLLILVDVIIGPLLTFAVYKKGKKYLKIDLALIAIMQISALVYGVYTIYGGRPSMVVMHKGQFHYLNQKFSNHNDLKFDDLKPNLFSKPKLAHIVNTQSLDIYSTYVDMLPIENQEQSLLPYSLNSENMKAKFTGKAAAIDAISKAYDGQEIVYFTLDKDMSKYYVVYSLTQKSIIDYLEF